jgi:hypothetical protein
MGELILRSLVLFFVSWFAGAWSAMLVVGNLHAWWSFIPAMSYGIALGITFPPLFVAAVVLLVWFVAALISS